MSTHNIYKTSIYTLISASTFGFASYYVQFSSKAVNAYSDPDAKYSYSESYWKHYHKNPYSMISEQAKSFGYAINQKVYGPIGKSQWNENNTNYAIISLFDSETEAFINTFAGTVCDSEIDSITYLFHHKAIKWHYITNNNNNFEKTQEQIVLWDIPCWDSNKYSAEQYIFEFALPLYDGIILLTNTRFRMIDAILFKEIYDCIYKLVPDAIYGQPDIHIPVYIIRTEFDYDLRIKLEQITATCNSNINKRWIDWIFPWPHSILSTDQFMHCLYDGIDQIYNETARKLDNVFYDNFWRIKRQLLNEQLFVVGTEWNNRMITNVKNNKYFGYYGLLYQMKMRGDNVDEMLSCHNENTCDSYLYKYYTKTEWKYSHYIWSYMFTSLTVISVFLCGTYLYNGYNVANNTNTAI